MLDQIYNHYAPQIKSRQHEMVFNGSAVQVAELLLFPFCIELHADMIDGTHVAKVVASRASEPGAVHARLVNYTGLDLSPIQIMDSGADYEAIMQAQDAMENLNADHA